MDELVDEQALNHAEPISVETERENMRKLEAAELRYFKRIRIQEDSTIYDAALAGYYKALAESLDDTTHVDGACGPWGTPLTAAVISDSSAVVRLLLEHGANPLLHEGPLGTPLRVSVLRGQDNILNDLLMAKFNGSTYSKSKILTSVMSSVLFTATMHNRMSSAEVLLMHGADPSSNYGSQLSAFLNAVVRNLHKFVELFIRYATSNRLLSWGECSFAIGASTRGCRESYLQPGFSKPQFVQCCTEMWEGRGKMMQELIRSRMDSVRGYDSYKWFRGWDGESLLLHSIKKRRAAAKMDESRIKDDGDSGSSVLTHAQELQIPVIKVPLFTTPSRSPRGTTHSPSGFSLGTTHWSSTFGRGITHWYCGYCYQGPMSDALESYCLSCYRPRTYSARYIGF